MRDASASTRVGATRTGSGRIVDLSVTMKPTGHLAERVLSVIPASGLDLLHERTNEAGGNVVIQITPTPHDLIAQHSFPKGSYMAAVLETWPNGQSKILWIARKGYATHREAYEAASGPFERILATLRG